MVKVTVCTEDDAKACPIRNVLDRVGDKWSLLVLLTLETDTKRFMEIKRSIGDISQRMLTQTLRSLEARWLYNPKSIFTDSSES